MNDNLLFEYLLEEGALAPDELAMQRKQAMVGALRGGAMEPLGSQMVSGHYVGEGVGGALSRLGQAYFAKKGQNAVDDMGVDLKNRRKTALQKLQVRMDPAGALKRDPLTLQDPGVDLELLSQMPQF